MSIGSRSSWRSALPWPLAVIDFEASSLDLEGYPIEVGLAVWAAPETPIFAASTLIRPDEAWTRHGHWSPASAKLHGIRGRDLRALGHQPVHVAAALNEALGANVAWCDGGAYDAQWARALFRTGRTQASFTLGDWHQLATLLGSAARERCLAWLEQAPARHRAREDAVQLLLALAHAVEAEIGPVQPLKLQLPSLVPSVLPIDASPRQKEP